MAMGSPSESPKLGYPVPSPYNSLTGPPARIILPHDRNPRFAYNIPTTTPSCHDKYEPCFTGTTIFLSTASVISMAILLFCIFGPRSPTFVVQQVSFHYPTSYESPTSTRFASSLNITMKVCNPAGHIGIFYEGHNSVVASYYGIPLYSGVIPPFFQGPKDETSVQSRMRVLGVVLPHDVKHKLEKDHKNRWVPLTLSVMGMTRFKMGSVSSKALLRVSCELVVDSFVTYTTNVVSSGCDSAAGFWVAAIRN